MVDPFEQKIMLQYLKNLVKARALSIAVMGEVCDFFETSLPNLGIQEDYEEQLELFDEFTSAIRNREGARKLLRPVRTAMQKLLNSRNAFLTEAQPGPLEITLQDLSSELNLDPQESILLGFLIRYHLHETLYGLINELTRGNMGVAEVCAACVGFDRNEVRRILGQKERLLNSGAVASMTRNGKDLDDHYCVPDSLLSAIRKAMGSQDHFRQYLLGCPVEANLDWQDYDHIAESRDRLVPFLSQAVEQQLTGINVLLYGPAGTGKTEFCKTLAAKLGLNLYALTEQDEYGEEPSRKERISGFQLAQNLLRYQKNSLLIFDEMDDMFEQRGMAAMLGGKYASGSKVFLNRLLENNPVPTIWTINEPRRLDETIIRRMSLAVEMKIPSLTTRQRVWQRQLALEDVHLPEKDLKLLAQSEVAPAIVHSAVRFAKLSGGALADYQFATQSIVKAMKGGNALKAEPNAEPFEAKLVVADCDLLGLADRIVENGRKDFSFCLYGPPGTGKSAYIRYLADRLKMPVLVKRTSDLLSMWVGGSEENIAEAFEEAKENESLLIFDEADSLLGDRRKARVSWEITQVNEMLTWMEQHPLPFACTTNLIGSLDQAAMRRFTFKAHFDYLGAQEICLAFEHFFGLSIGAGRAEALRFMTPGDFTVVKKKVDFWNQGQDIDRIIELLQQEVAVKNEKLKTDIGFQA